MPPTADLIAPYDGPIRRIEAAVEELAAIPNEIDGQLFAIRNDDRLSDEGRAEAVRELRERETARVERLRDQIATNRETAARGVDAALRAAAGSTTERLLVEQQEARGWDRARRQLEAGTRPSDVIDAARSDGDATTLRALRVELPSWIRAEAAGARRNGQATAADLSIADTGTLLDRIDAALLDILPPSEAAPIRARQRLMLAAEQAEAELRRTMFAAAGTASPTQRMAAAYAREDIARRRR